MLKQFLITAGTISLSAPAQRRLDCVQPGTQHKTGLHRQVALPTKGGWVTTGVGCASEFLAHLNKRQKLRGIHWLGIGHGSLSLVVGK